MPGLIVLSDIMFTIVEGLRLTCYTQGSCTAASVGRVNHIVDIVLPEIVPRTDM